MPVVNPHRIELKTDGVHDEARLTVAAYPGYLMERVVPGVDGVSLATCKPHAGGPSKQKLFCKEQALIGGTIRDVLAIGELAPLIQAAPEDVIYARVRAACPAFVALAPMISYGGGTLTPAGANGANLYNSVADSAAVTNTVTETAFDKSYTIPANFLRVGDVIRVRAVVATPSTNSTDTLNVKLKIGSTVIVATGAVDVANSDTGVIDVLLTIRSIGASGTFVASGVSALGVPGTVTAKATALGSTAIDTTATQAITVTAQWSVASASNSAVLSNLSVSLDRLGDDGMLIGYADEACDNSAEAEDEAFFRLRVAA